MATQVMPLPAAVNLGPAFLSSPSNQVLSFISQSHPPSLNSFLTQAPQQSHLVQNIPTGNSPSSNGVPALSAAGQSSAATLQSLRKVASANALHRHAQSLGLFNNQAALAQMQGLMSEFSMYTTPATSIDPGPVTNGTRFLNTTGDAIMRTSTYLGGDEDYANAMRGPSPLPNSSSSILSGTGLSFQTTNDISSLLQPPFQSQSAHPTPTNFYGQAPPPLARAEYLSDGQAFSAESLPTVGPIAYQNEPWLYSKHIVSASASLLERLWPLELTLNRVANENASRGSNISMGVSSSGFLSKLLPLRRYIRNVVQNSRATHSTLILGLYYIFKCREALYSRAREHLATLRSCRHGALCCGLTGDAHEMTFQPSNMTSLPLNRCSPPAECQVASEKVLPAYTYARRLMAASIMVASKVHNDQNYSTSSWAHYCDMSRQEMVLMEREVLFMNNHSLFVAPDVFAAFERDLMNFNVADDTGLNGNATALKLPWLRTGLYFKNPLAASLVGHSMMEGYMNVRLPKPPVSKDGETFTEWMDLVAFDSSTMASQNTQPTHLSLPEMSSSRPGHGTLMTSKSMGSLALSHLRANGSTSSLPNIAQAAADTTPPRPHGKTLAKRNSVTTLPAGDFGGTLPSHYFLTSIIGGISLKDSSATTNSQDSMVWTSGSLARNSAMGGSERMNPANFQQTSNTPPQNYGPPVPQPVLSLNFNTNMPADGPSAMVDAASASITLDAVVPTSRPTRKRPPSTTASDLLATPRASRSHPNLLIATQNLFPPGHSSGRLNNAGMSMNALTPVADPSSSLPSPLSPLKSASLAGPLPRNSVSGPSGVPTGMGGPSSGLRRSSGTGRRNRAPSKGNAELPMMSFGNGGFPAGTSPSQYSVSSGMSNSTGSGAVGFPTDSSLNWIQPGIRTSWHGIADVRGINSGITEGRGERAPTWHAGLAHSTPSLAGGQGGSSGPWTSNTSSNTNNAPQVTTPTSARTPYERPSRGGSGRHNNRILAAAEAAMAAYDPSSDSPIAMSWGGMYAAASTPSQSLPSARLPPMYPSNLDDRMDE